MKFATSRQRQKLTAFFFYSNFVFSKLKVTNMTHTELPFVLLVFGTQLTSKNIKEFHVVQKNYWD